MRTLPTLLDGPDRERTGPGRWGWLAAGIWLFYLSQPFEEIIHRQGTTRVLGLVTLSLFALSYLGFFGWVRWVGLGAGGMPTWQRLLYLGGMLALCLLMLPAAGQQALTCLVYISAVAMMAVDLRIAIGIVALLLGGAELSMRIVPGWTDDGSYGFAIFLGALAVFGMRRAIQRSLELNAARKDMAELAVQEERNRFARDLHDILGHSLTVITVKAELAGKLIAANPARAAAEVADVESLARAALADVRAAVAGYRELRLAGERASACRPPRSRRTSRPRSTRFPRRTASCSPGWFGKASRTSSGTPVRSAARSGSRRRRSKYSTTAKARRRAAARPATGWSGCANGRTRRVRVCRSVRRRAAGSGWQ